MSVELHDVIAISTAVLTPLLAANLFFVKGLVKKLDDNTLAVNQLNADVAVIKYAVEEFKTERYNK